MTARKAARPLRRYVRARSRPAMLMRARYTIPRDATGIDPKATHEWYLSVYADAYEWVEAPNTIGMALHADGGLLASKPYAASANYIKRMSNFCGGCAYDPSVSVGDRACPFNALYWDFLARHRDRFGGNARMPYVYSTWDKMGDEKQSTMRRQAQDHLTAMREGRL